MQTGFDNTNVLSLWLGEDVPDLLPNGFEFWWRNHRYRHAPGGHTDGLSSPQFLHLDKDVDSRDWAYPAAVCHDGGYHNDLEILRNDNSWESFTLTKDECDSMFKELMDTLAVTAAQKAQAIIFYEAVHLFGGPAFSAGRNGITA